VSTNGNAEHRREPGSIAVGVVCGLVASLLLLAGLSSYGLWSDAELPVLTRSQAALGAALADLERSPWLPDAVRTASFALFGGELGIRLPHALAAAALCGVTAGVARARGTTAATAVLAGAFVLAFPALQLGGRTVLGNPIAEVLGVLAVVFGWAALAKRSRSQQTILAALALASLALSVASSGLLLGACIPLSALAIASGRGQRREVTTALWSAAVVTATIVLLLAIRQEEGYIPLLAAAKDLDLREDPLLRPFTAGIEEFGYQVFPWIPLVVIGVLTPTRDRWPALWLLVGLSFVSVWTLFYGQVSTPLLMPAALCCADGFEHLRQEEGGRAARRLALVVVIGGMLIMGKDARRVPSRAGCPLSHFAAERDHPAEEIGVPELLSRVNRIGMLGILLVVLIAPRRESGWRARLLERVPPGVRDLLPQALMIAALAHQAIVYGHVLVPRMSTKLSTRHLLERHEAWVEAGQLPAVLAMHRVRDRGVEHYGPEPERLETFDGRHDLIARFSGEAPVAALVRTSELAPLHQHHRRNGWPLFVLDTSHARLLLIANVLPEGTEDVNPILEILFDENVPLENETLLEFDERVQIVGWEIETPLVRGSRPTLKLMLRVLKSLPGGAKIQMRFKKRKLSWFNADWHELAENIYPCSHWREGDYVLHRFSFDMPVLEVFSGPYDLLIALRRSAKKNFPITIPDGKRGDFGVEVPGRKRSFAKIGEVDVL
jgi:hypothetical protein